MTELEPLDLAVHRLKVQAHRALRWLDDRREPVQPARASRLLVGLPRVAEDRSPLWNRDIDAREWPLELGKLENLRIAARSLDGLELEAEQVFSFWAQLGPPLRVRGFVPGRELRDAGHRRRSVPALQRLVRRRRASRVHDPRAAPA